MSSISLPMRPRGTKSAGQTKVISRQTSKSSILPKMKDPSIEGMDACFRSIYTSPEHRGFKTPATSTAAAKTSGTENSSPLISKADPYTGDISIAAATSASSETEFGFVVPSVPDWSAFNNFFTINSNNIPSSASSSSTSYPSFRFNRRSSSNSSMSPPRDRSPLSGVSKSFTTPSPKRTPSPISRRSRRSSSPIQKLKSRGTTALVFGIEKIMPELSFGVECDLEKINVYA